MTTLPDLLYVALFAVALPLRDYLVFWPAFHRRSQGDPARARRWLCVLLSQEGREVRIGPRVRPRG